MFIDWLGFFWFAFMISLAAFFILLPTKIWSKIRRPLIILIWGYGMDFMERVVALLDAFVVNGLRALIEPDYAREILTDARR